jgi:Nucleotidyl transferase AbiEii toxin, Type IV TA system
MATINSSKLNMLYTRLAPGTPLTSRLLTQVAPLVFVDDTFALKGGTAINLFVRDMPRLSVDLDLVFPDHTLPRDPALARINEAIRQAVERLKKRGFQTYVPAAEAGETKLLVRRGPIQVKIEVNFVMRGAVQPVRQASLTPVARDVLMAAWKSLWCPWKTCTAASWSRRWIGSTRATYSTSCSSSRTRASHPAFGVPSSSTWPAATVRSTGAVSTAAGHSV